MAKQVLSNYLDQIQSEGKYFIRKDEVLNNLGIKEQSFRNQVHFLHKKGKICKARDGIYLIVPPEYKNFGTIPPEWFIDQLMEGSPYYVGLLSAAYLYGLTHQQPQSFQVISAKALPSLNIGRLHINFIINSTIKNSEVQKYKSKTGYFNISSVEQTIIDLVKYYKHGGYYSNVCTIYSEMKQICDERKLYKMIIEQLDSVLTQRIGYLLSIAHYNKTAELIRNWIAVHVKRYSRLAPYIEDINEQQKDPEWKLHINEDIELDI
jgi:predicted transcriptional regulator of viral defense system